MPLALLHNKPQHLHKYSFHVLARCTAVLQVTRCCLITHLTTHKTLNPSVPSASTLGFITSEAVMVGCCYNTLIYPYAYLRFTLTCVPRHDLTQEIDAASHEVKRRCVLLDPRTSTGAVMCIVL